MENIYIQKEWVKIPHHLNKMGNTVYEKKVISNLICHFYNFEKWKHVNMLMLNLIGGISQSTLNMKIPQIKLGKTEFLLASLTFDIAFKLNFLVHVILKIY